MRTTLVKLALVLTVATATTSVSVLARTAPAGPAPASRLDLRLASIGALSFGADGTLFVADPIAATIFAIELAPSTLPKGSSSEGTISVDALDQKIASLAGTAATEIAVKDIAVDPKSRNTFISVMRGTGAAAQPALFRVDGKGAVALVPLDAAKFTSVALPNPIAAATAGRNNRSQSVTQMSLVDGKLYVTGLSNEEFSSKFWAIPYPFKSADQGTSVEIWHTSHNKFETASPVLAFVPTKSNGRTDFIAGYTCTPLVRFPVTDLKPGAKVMGTTIAELGAGNQPIDMVLYNKGGKEYVLMANTRHGVLKIGTEQFSTAPGLTTRIDTTAGVPAEKITSVTGVIQLSLLDATRSVMLMRANGALNLAAVDLP